MQVDQDRGEHDEGKRTGEERGFFSTDGLRSDMEVAPLPVPAAEHTHVGALTLLIRPDEEHTEGKMVLRAPLANLARAHGLQGAKPEMRRLPAALALQALRGHT